MGVASEQGPGAVRKEPGRACPSLEEIGLARVRVKLGARIDVSARLGSELVERLGLPGAIRDASPMVALPLKDARDVADLRAPTPEEKKAFGCGRH